MIEKKPNCICLAADQLRYDVLGKGFTPHIDDLIRDSVYFPRGYCASPLCVPARGSLFTGTYPGVNGSLINGWLPSEAGYSRVKEGIDHLYGVMEQLGMDCVHSGKQHLFVEGIPLQEREETKTKWVSTEQSYRSFVRESGKRMPGGADFRTPVPEMTDGVHTRVCSYSNPHTGRYEEGMEYYFDGYFTDRALKALDEYDGEKPLFLSMMYLAPHPPFDVPKPWYSRVTPQQVVMPENVGQWYPCQSPLQKYNLTGVIGNGHSMEEWREAWRVYLGLVGLLDHCVGKVIEKLKEKGLYDNSLIFFGSDHGEMLGSHCLFQKMCMYEESVRTPFCLRLPGGRGRGRMVEEAVSHVDVFPTICDYYGVSVRHKMDGRSLLGRMTGEEGSAPRPVFIQYDGNASRGNFQRCVIWKGHKWIADVFKDECFYELYDIYKDPMETRNLAAEEEFDGLSLELDGLLRGHGAEISDFLTLLPFDPKRFRREYRE